MAIEPVYRRLQSIPDPQEKQQNWLTSDTSAMQIGATGSCPQIQFLIRKALACRLTTAGQKCVGDLLWLLQSATAQTMHQRTYRLQDGGCQNSPHKNLSQDQV
jgi:hypothetical protein